MVLLRDTSMIRILISLLLLEATFGSVRSTEHTQPTVEPSKTFGQPGNYITTVIFVDLPHFSDSTEVGDVLCHSDQFQIQYSGVKFERLSSAYSLRYKIDLDANKVQLLLHLGKACIKGTYSVSTSSSPSTPAHDFELNLYANLFYTYNIEFQFENGKATFGKTDDYRLLHKKVKGKYVNAPSGVASSLENYLDPKLLEAVVAKIYQEVSPKMSLVDVGYQIKNEHAFRQREEIAGRFKKAIVDIFDDVVQNRFNVHFPDRADFKRIIQNCDVEIKTFVLRNVEGLLLHDLKISFVGDDVHARVIYRVKSPNAIFRLAYSCKHNPLAQNKIVKAEYFPSNYTYDFELIAKPATKTVELGNVHLSSESLQVAPSQGLYGDERDIIIKQLTPCVKTYFEYRANDAFLVYIKGLVAEGRMAHQTFK